MGFHWALRYRWGLPTPRLSHTQEETRRHVSELAARSLSPEALGTGILTALEVAVPTDGGRLFGVDPATLLINRLLAASRNDGEARLEWLRDVYLAAGALTYLEIPTIMRAGLPTVAFYERQPTCWGYPSGLLGRVSDHDHTRLFHELACPLGGGLLAHFSTDGRWIAAMQVYRRDPAWEFQPNKVRFVRSLVPTISRALAAAFNRERALRNVGTVGPDVAGVLVLSRDGRVRLSTPAAEAWCAALRDAHRDGHAPLPTAVWSAIARLHAGAEAEGTAVVLAHTTAGAIRVEASRTGEGDARTVVLTPQRASTPEPPPTWPLTRAEHQVVVRLLGGLSNRQIAASLEVGDNTIEWHLRNVYDKLGVRGRTGLMARLFRDAFLPQMIADHDGDPPTFPA